MSTEMSELMTVAAGPVTAAVRAVRDDQLELPTPCPDFRVRDLLNHLFHAVGNFQRLAEREAVDWANTPDSLHGDWRERFGAEVGELARAWSDPRTLDGVSPGMGLPQAVLARMITIDLLVHGWDLSRAIGRDYVPDPVLFAVAREFVATMGDTARKMGAFGPPVAVDADAGELAQVLGSTGRDPGWQPA